MNARETAFIAVFLCAIRFWLFLQNEVNNG